MRRNLKTFFGAQCFKVLFSQILIQLYLSPAALKCIGLSNGMNVVVVRHEVRTWYSEGKAIAGLRLLVNGSIIVKL